MAWRCYLGKDRFLEDPLSLIRQYQPKHCLPELCGGGGGGGGGFCFALVFLGFGVSLGASVR